MHSNTQQIDDYKKALGVQRQIFHMHFFFTSLCLNFYHFDFRFILNKNGVFIKKKNVNAFLQSVKKCKEHFLDALPIISMYIKIDVVEWSKYPELHRFKMECIHIYKSEISTVSNEIRIITTIICCHSNSRISFMINLHRKTLAFRF